MELFKEENFTIFNQNIECLVRINKNSNPIVPRLVIPSKLLNGKSVELLRLCIQTIRKYTKQYELWIVDNNSPEEYVSQFLDLQDINFVLIKTNILGGGSYENAVALEIAAELIAKDTKYLMTLHQDIVVCKDGWLEDMTSRIKGNVKAVGVREDKVRVKEGILHVLGYVIDFQLFKELQLTFKPELPNFDVGDRVIYDFKEKGFEYFAYANTIWNAELVNKMPASSPFKKINVDRAIDDEDDVFFMHLGRGVLKSQGQIANEDKGIDLWIKFVNKYIL